MTNEWLPLTDYSTKYKVSVSTLRRRIKAEDIPFRLHDGKYFLVDEPPMGAHQKHRPSPDSELNLMGAHPVKNDESAALSRAAHNDEPILTAANKLLNDLKKAYTQVLHEKEEQILSLKEEIADLKTLVKALEGETRRKNLQRSY